MKHFKCKLPILLCLYGILSGSLVAQAQFPQQLNGDEIGFTSIFDGKTLADWDGDSVYWRVEDGKLVGVVTPETILERNTFIIWRGGTTANFELKMEYKVSAQGNSGINYRSVEVDGVPFALKGYQCDIDGKGKWTGQNYEERGRKFLALRGQVSKIDTGEKAFQIGTVGNKDSLQEFIKQENWNECHLIIRDNTLTHMINGHVMCVVVDDDVKNRKNEGLLGMQVHVGPPMKIEYRNIRIKNF
jgi:hypothetical protein